MNPTPSKRELLGGSSAALLVASGILVVAVLPAEFGRDPTGLGRRLGLFRLSTGGGAAVSRAYPSPFRTDSAALLVEPGKSLEYKAVLPAGHVLVYSWSAEGGPLAHIFHGEPSAGPAGYWQSYREATGTADHGSLTAPFTGTHGWYWKNEGAAPVRVHLVASGFYESIGRPE